MMALSFKCIRVWGEGNRAIKSCRTKGVSIVQEMGEKFAGTIRIGPGISRKSLTYFLAISNRRLLLQFTYKHAEKTMPFYEKH